MSDLYATASVLADLVAALTCPDCAGINSAGCDTCDHTGHLRCQQRTGPAEHCETPRPCTRHDRALLEQAAS
jgi:hypothetical protein